MPRTERQAEITAGLRDILTGKACDPQGGLGLCIRAALPMKSKLWIANFGFLPRSCDLALLCLRLALGFSMIALHGWPKLTDFSATLANFSNPLGTGRHLSLFLALTAEILGSALLLIGALSRFAAAVLAI